jgi:hypothetical protein
METLLKSTMPIRDPRHSISKSILNSSARLEADSHDDDDEIDDSQRHPPSASLQKTSLMRRQRRKASRVRFTFAESNHRAIARPKIHWLLGVSELNEKTCQ